jgi:3,4-dihydroxy 2-butanone 4-phosphate synthase/GTP cyclohydrolase II
VHSECLTGDVFGSLYCDCGEQLHRSLERLQKEKGVCLYLRQEGRGIGLFEKMKAYQLQRDGFDTYEANIKLGHAPDERTYEMVKIALDDLRIKKIRLLTNNSAKAAAIQSLGVEVVECVPVVIPSNEYNQAYLHAKQSRLGV